MGFQVRARVRMHMKKVGKKNQWMTLTGGKISSGGVKLGSV